LSNLYGNTQSDKKLKKIETCRKIVKQILDFGVSNDQILFIIELLAYNLENMEHTRELVAMSKEFTSEPMTFLEDMPLTK
jgi:hypothetical protein